MTAFRGVRGSRPSGGGLLPARPPLRTVRDSFPSIRLKPLATGAPGVGTRRQPSDDGRASSPAVPTSHHTKNSPWRKSPPIRLNNGNTISRLRKPWAKTIGTQPANKRARGSRTMRVCSDGLIRSSPNTAAQWRAAADARLQGAPSRRRVQRDSRAAVLSRKRMLYHCLASF